jgi:hypothetical protein
MIKKIKAMHWIWRDYQKIVTDARYEIDPRIRLIAERGSFLGKDHYYYVKGDEIKSLVNIPKGMSGLIHHEHWELCNPREYFGDLNSADDRIKELFNEDEIEEIDHSNECLSQDDIRKMFGLKEESPDERVG